MTQPRLRITTLVFALAFGSTLFSGTAVHAQKPPPELRKVHALLIVDTRSGLGNSVVIDGDRIKELLEGGIPKDKLELTMMTGRDVTTARILEYYKNLKADSNDALFFFYAGHGAIDPEKGHFLALQELNTKPLLRADLRKAMLEKKPGLMVLLTDCCSSRFELKNKKRRVTVEVGHAKELSPVLRSLLFQHRGIVDITAASDNTVAFGDDFEGGIFTRTFCGLLTGDLAKLDTNQDKFVSWSEVFAIVQKDTESTFTGWAKEHRALGEKVDQSTQKPRAMDLPDAVTLVNDGSTPLKYEYRWKGDSNWESTTLAVKASMFHPAPVGKAATAILEVKFETGETGSMKPGKSYRWVDPKKK